MYLSNYPKPTANSKQPNSNETTEMYENFTSQQVQQTTFVDERATAVETGYISGQATLPRSRKAMNESPFSMLDCLRQPILYDRLSWTVAGVRGANLWTATVPGVFNSLSTIHKLPLQIYQFFKFTMKVKLVLNTTKFHAGKLLLWYDPVNTVDSTSGDRNAIVFHTGTLIEATGYPNVVLDAKDSNVAELEIPWEHVLSTFSLSNNSLNTRVPLGTVHLQILNPLKVPETAVTDADVSIYISCIDLELHVPTRPHNNNFIAAMGNVISGGKKALSSGIGAVTDIASGNFSSGVGKIGDVAGHVGGILKDFDLDKPSKPDAKISNCLSTVSPQAHMKTVDDTVRLGACPAAGYLEDEFSNAPVEELIIKDIIKKPMLLGTVAWNSTDLPDTLLLQIPVTPTLLLGSVNDRILLSNLGAVEVPTSGGTLVQTYYRYYPSYLMYLSQMFEFWKGSIDFRFDFASTSFHTGRLQISFEPTGQPLPLDTTMSPTSAFSSCPNQVFDLHESSSTKFKCDYVSMTPMKRVINPVSNPDPDDEQILGYLRIYVLTKLERPENLSDIEFNIYISAGEDFTLLSPRLNFDSPLLADLSKLPYDVPSEFRAAMGEGSLGDDVVTRTSDVKDYPHAIKDGGMVDSHDVFGERIETVLDLARRYTVVADYAPVVSQQVMANTGLEAAPFVISGDEASISIVNTPTDPCIYIQDDSSAGTTIVYRSTPAVSSFMRRLAPMYVFWSGSMRYQFIPYVDRVNPMMMEVTYAFSNSMRPQLGLEEPADDWIAPQGGGHYRNYINSSYPRTTNLTAQDSAISVEIPFYTEMNQCLTMMNGQTSTTMPLIEKNLDPWLTGIVQCRFTGPTFGNSVITVGTAKFLPVRINSSIGDDFKFRYLISPPVCLCRDPTSTPGI